VVLVTSVKEKMASQEIENLLKEEMIDLLLVVVLVTSVKEKVVIQEITDNLVLATSVKEMIDLVHQKASIEEVMAAEEDNFYLF
jgi:hypothetical protein